MNKVLKKFLIILLVILTLNNFFMQPVAQAAELGAFEEAVEVVVNILGGLVGLLTLPERFLAIQTANQINNLSAGIAYIDNGANKPETITPYEILFNKVKIVDINFFNIGSATGTQEGAIVNKIRLGVSGWFYAMRNISAAILLCILLYVGIRMAISTIASDRAMYKKMLVDWVCSLVLIFVLQYIMIFTIYCNNAIVNAISFTSDPNAIKAAYDKIAELAMKTFSINSLAAVIVYCMLVWQTLGLFFSYLNRMIKIAFLIIISPLISITYSIDKIGDGKAQALGNWLKEFVFTVLIQPFHCAIYMCLISTSLNILVQNAGGGNDEETLAGAIIAILCIKFTKDAEKIIKKIFAFKSDDSKTSIAGGLAISAMALNNAKGLGRTARGVATGAANMFKNSKGMVRNVKIEAMAAAALLTNKDGTDKSFEERKEEAAAKVDNAEAEKLERKNAKYSSRQRMRAVAAAQKASGEGYFKASNMTRDAIEAERQEKIDAKAQEKFDESGGTMSMEAARAAARKEIAKEERDNARPVRRAIKGAKGRYDKFKNNLNKSAMVKVLGDYAKSKTSNALGLMAGAGMYGTNGDLAKSIMGGAAVASSAQEFLKSSGNTMVNQSMDAVDRLGAKDRGDLSNKLDTIFANADKYDHSSKTPEELKKLLIQVDDLLANVDYNKAENYKTRIKNIFSENTTNAPDALAALFSKMKHDENVTKNVNIDSDDFKNTQNALMNYGAMSAIYATMKQGESIGMSQETYKQSLLDSFDAGAIDTAYVHSTRKLHSRNDKTIEGAMAIKESYSEKEDEDLQPIVNEYDTEHDIMKLFQDMTDEIEAEQRVKHGFELTQQDQMAKDLEARIQTLEDRRDKIMIEAVSQHHSELVAGKSKLAQRYREALERRYADLMREAQNNKTQYIRDEIKHIEGLAKKANVTLK